MDDEYWSQQIKDERLKDNSCAWGFGGFVNVFGGLVGQGGCGVFIHSSTRVSLSHTHMMQNATPPPIKNQTRARSGTRATGPRPASAS